MPNVSATSLENDSIMVNELKRAISFAEGATNPKSKIDLIELAMKFNINFEIFYQLQLKKSNNGKQKKDRKQEILDLILESVDNKSATTDSMKKLFTKKIR